MPSYFAGSDIIRLATREDIPRVWELVQELAEFERLTHTVTGDCQALEHCAFNQDLIDVFVLEVEGQIVGYTISFRTFSTFRAQPGIWLEDLYVSPPFRGKGFGRALLQNLMKIGEQRECGRLEWSVLDWNEPAIRFYEAMGATVLPDWRMCRVSMPLSSSQA